MTDIIRAVGLPAGVYRLLIQVHTIGSEGSMSGSDLKNVAVLRSLGYCEPTPGGPFGACYYLTQKGRDAIGLGCEQKHCQGLVTYEYTLAPSMKDDGHHKVCTRHLAMMRAVAESIGATVDVRQVVNDDVDGYYQDTVTQYLAVSDPAAWVTLDAIIRECLITFRDLYDKGTLDRALSSLLRRGGVHVIEIDSTVTKNGLTMAYRLVREVAMGGSP